MVEAGQIYKCSKCGNIVEVLVAGGGSLVCCNASMELLQEKSGDTGKEKHVPVIERDGDVVTVKVGSVSHPMQEDHYIQFIELYVDGKIYRKNLKPGDLPEARFEVKDATDIRARSYCNLHGLWKS
ncbi:desulfoferrodoxin [Caldanaerobius polysaccharolyticus]|uniref:desulfoferrodoxin n=1 Tax=Caldanaerobius polysaccharolyticus TaxID=44256 RepID=UPI000478D3BC|nr:desulfoferrodoxin [Caldanaerobius polysaccharolyticus]